MLNETSEILEGLLDKVNNQKETPLRLENWPKTIQWKIEQIDFFWKADSGYFKKADPEEADIILTCTKETLLKILNRELPLFIAIWVTKDIQIQGSFADAYRLGYLFLDDARRRKIVFLSHCFLNINTRFPQGCAYAGANIPVINTLLRYELGIVQMPCPEFLCMGLEKELYGEIPEPELRRGFSKIANGVLDEIEAYLKLGFEVQGIIGMNPSPSCGVESTKGKGTMLGLDRDTTEKDESGVFIEEMKQLAETRGMKDLPFFGIRRMLPGEEGIEQRIETLDQYLS